MIGWAFFGQAMLAIADEAPALPAGTTGAEGAAPGAQPGFGQMIVPFLLMFGVMYFLVMRPQQKKMKEQQSMLAALASGDDVLTTSGIFGSVAGLTEKFVTLEVAKDVKIKVLKSQISQVVKGKIEEIK